jgi:hypothetical protein
MKIILKILTPKPNSTTSNREYHQNAFKVALANRYKCVHPENSNVLKCMVLNYFFSKHEVIASHIIGLNHSVSFAILKLPEAAVWSDRNGLLVYKAFEKKYEAHEIVRDLTVILN